MVHPQIFNVSQGRDSRFTFETAADMILIVPGGGKHGGHVKLRVVESGAQFLPFGVWYVESLRRDERTGELVLSGCDAIGALPATDCADACQALLAADEKELTDLRKVKMYSAASPGNGSLTTEMSNVQFVDIRTQ